MCDNNYGLPLALIFEELIQIDKPEPERNERNNTGNGETESPS